MKLVSVIVINWNGKQFLKECFSSLTKQKYKNIEIILVDNASTDDSVVYVKKNFPKIKIIVNKENLGFAQANNIGYTHAKGDYILFLNNDTRVTNNFLVELVKVLENDKTIGGVQSKILLMDDSTRLDSVGAFLTPTGFLYHYGVAKKDSSKYDKQIDIYSAKGACMLFRKEVLEKIMVDGEIFDSRYFAYFEETDMCHRIWLTGYKIVFVPRSVIYHKMGGTSSKLANPFVQYHSFKNRINSYIKNLTVKELFYLLPVHLFLSEIFSFAAFLTFKFRLFLAIQKSIFWNLLQIKSTLKKRNYIQKNIKNKSFKAYRKFYKKVNYLYYFYLFTGNLGKYNE